MFGLWLFLHITSISIWLGSIVAVAFMLMMIRNHKGKDTNALVRNTVKVFNRLSHPSSFIVLITGVAMLIQQSAFKDQPLWLKYMQDLGTLVILVSIAVLSILGKKLTKRLADGSQQGAPAIGGFLNWLWIFAILILSVIFVVAYRFV